MMQQNKIKLIILDRDGVINEDSDNYIRSEHQWIPIPGSIEAIANLFHAGYQVAVATNQSGLGRGYFTRKDLIIIHEKMCQLITRKGAHLRDICFCPHTPEAQCDCRKPKPGMIKKLITDTKSTPSATWVIGDSLRDLQAGQSANCKTGLVLTGKGKKTLETINTASQHEKNTVNACITNTSVFNDLASFAEKILTEEI